MRDKKNTQNKTYDKSRQLGELGGHKNIKASDK